MPSHPTASLGIDIGGSGIKGAPVDTATGRLLAERQRIETPQPATPEAVTETVAQLVAGFGWTGPVGATFPGIVRHGVIGSAARAPRSRPLKAQLSYELICTPRSVSSTHIRREVVRVKICVCKKKEKVRI